MKRALFAHEFRTALVPNLVTAGAILGTLVILERLLGPRLGRAEDIRVFTDVALLVGLVVSGFISGERCFPAEVKESRIFFLTALPISRSWAWLTIVSARLLAAVISLALVVALRRPLLESIDLLRRNVGFPSTDLLVWAGALFSYVLLFLAGTFFALLFRRTLFSYAAGFLILGALLIETLFSSSYSTESPKLAALVTIPNPRWHSSLVIFLSLLLVSLLVLSWRFFVRGEIGNPKRRTRNQLLFAAASAAYLGSVFYLAASPRFATVPTGRSSRYSFDQFDTNVLGESLPSGVSPDGRYLFVFESWYVRPFMVQVSIVDTGTGHITGRSVYAGAAWGFWSDRGDVLNLLVVNNSPLDRWGYLVPGSVDWIRLSPKAREISTLRLKGVEGVESLAEGKALVVLREGGQGRVLLLDGASGRSSEVVRAPLDGEVSVRGDGTAALVFFKNILLPRRAWAVDSLAREVRVPRSTREAAFVLFGELLGASSEVQTALLHRFGLPPEDAIRGHFLLLNPDKAFYLKPELTGLYFLEERAPQEKVLWVRSTAPEGRWKKLSDIAPNGAFLLDVSVQESALDAVSFINPASEISERLFTIPNRPCCFVYDPQLAGTLEVKGCSPKEGTSLSTYQVTGLAGTLIALTCLEAGVSERGRTYFFEHLPGSREMRTIKTVPARFSILSRTLYLDERGWEVWESLDQGIWRFSPRMKLRLWPPISQQNR